MKVIELIDVLEQLAKDGKGLYEVIQDGYARELTREDIAVYDGKEEIWV